MATAARDQFFFLFLIFWSLPSVLIEQQLDNKKKKKKKIIHNDGGGGEDNDKYVGVYPLAVAVNRVAARLPPSSFTCTVRGPSLLR